MRRALQSVSLLFSGALFLICSLSPFRTQAQSSPSGAPKDASPPPIVLAHKISIPGVPNAGKISETLFRGAQPAVTGLEQLKQLGFTTVVNLRGWEGAVSSERKKAEVLGLRFINIPVSGWSPPSDEQVAQFLSLFHEAPGEKIFIHCKYGEDRTGVMIAAYRIAESHWSAKQAMEEMYFFGFHKRWHPSMQSYVRKFPGKLASDPAFASLRAAPMQK
jgi:tyrosine-protein phosphatase SIW14